MKRKLALLLVAGVLLWPAGAWAAAVKSVPPGITVSPARLDFTIGKKTKQQTAILTIKNSYTVPVQLTAAFKGIDEASGLFVPTNNLDPGLGTALHISQTYLTVPASGQEHVEVAVNNVSSLGPGGHYATLILTQTGGRPGSLKAELTIGLFIVKTEGAHVVLRLSSFTTNGWLLALPTSATLNFANAGNVHVVPRAAVDLTGRGGRLLGRGIANGGSLTLLPDETMASPVAIGGLGHAWLPGSVRVSVTYRADGSNQTKTVSRTLFYLPPVYPLTVLFVGLIIWLLYRRRRNLARFAAEPARAPTPVTPVDAPPAVRTIQVAFEAAAKRIIAVIDQGETVKIPIKTVSKRPKVVKTTKKPTAKRHS